MRILYSVLALAIVVVLGACDHQHPKGSLSVNKELVVAASPTEVWNVMGDFYSWHHWHPAVASSQKSGAKIPTRLLILGNGGVIREELVDYKDGHSYTYQIESSPLPLANYVSTISVQPHDGGSKVIWRGDFDPAEGTSNDDAVELVTGIYQSGLDSLAKKVDD